MMIHPKSNLLVVAVVLVALSSLLTSSTDALRPYRYLDILHNIKQHHHIHIHIHNNNNRINNTNISPTEPDQYPDVQELYFVQRLDHFDPLNRNTFQQRYFYSDRYVSHQHHHHQQQQHQQQATRTSITFLCVGGEGPGFTKSVLVDSDHCTGDMVELAKKLYEHYHISVHMYALEHRYYGKSYPSFDSDSDSNNPVTTSHLRYLSSRQALEDLAHFVQSMTMTMTTPSDIHTSLPTTTIPWITFGGSYPGYMAGNARLKYPHLIFAAVSNSAPLDLMVDFPGYNERVGWDLAYDVIGGSQQCWNIVKNGHNEAVALLEKDPIQLGQAFHVCNPETALMKKENQNLFLGDGLIEIYAQGNDPSCQDNDLCNIERLCQFMIDTKQKRTTNTDSSDLDILIQVANKQRGNDTNCRSIDFDELLQELAKPVLPDDFGWRSWLWQTCTEVGFYQTCIHDTCPYATHYHTVDQDLTICQAAYNITTVYENVQATRDYYGGLDISAGSRVLSVNGDVDPWSVLGLHKSPKYSLPVEMVTGASHHFWTHPVKDSDSIEVQQIREYIYSVVMDWLEIDESRLDQLEDADITRSTEDLKSNQEQSNALRGSRFSHMNVLLT